MTTRFWHLMELVLDATGGPLFEYGCRLIHAYQTCEEAPHRAPRWLQHGLGRTLFEAGDWLMLRRSWCVVRRMRANGRVWR